MAFLGVYFMVVGFTSDDMHGMQSSVSCRTRDIEAKEPPGELTKLKFRSSSSVVHSSLYHEKENISHNASISLSDDHFHPHCIIRASRERHHLRQGSGVLYYMVYGLCLSVHPTRCSVYTVETIPSTRKLIPAAFFRAQTRLKVGRAPVRGGWQRNNQICLTNPKLPYLQYIVKAYEEAEEYCKVVGFTCCV
jgi:hypothetical protein